MNTEPKTLQDAVKYFAVPQNCHDYLVARRWPDGNVTCPKCGSANVTYYDKYRRFHCRDKHEAPQFTLKTGTVMEDSPIAIEKWLVAIWQLVNCKNGISSYELHRAIGVTQKTAWFMLQRIRLAMQSGSTVKLGGTGRDVEVDETYIGGKSRFMHPARRERMRQTGDFGKTAVQGLLERQGEVRAIVIGGPHHAAMRKNVKAHVEEGSNVYTDEAVAYRLLNKRGYLHSFINHAEAYVHGKVHTNGLENFWSLLKRGLKGTYVSVEPFHLFRYVDEQAFRYNNRKDANGDPLTDSDRFETAMSQIVGKRLTFAEVTGKVGASVVTHFESSRAAISS